MFNNKLIKLSSTENSGITRFTENEPVECNIQFAPKIGEPIIAYGKSLTYFYLNEQNGIVWIDTDKKPDYQHEEGKCNRLIQTSYVVKIEDNIYTTETGSKYKITGEIN